MKTFLSFTLKPWGNACCTYSTWLAEKKKEAAPYGVASFLNKFFLLSRFAHA